MATNSAQISHFRVSSMPSTYSDAVLTVIQRTYAPLRHASKLLARDAKASPRTAEKWISGQNAPSGEALIELMASCQELADEVNRLVAERRSAREIPQNIRR